MYKSNIIRIITKIIAVILVLLYLPALVPVVRAEAVEIVYGDMDGDGKVSVEDGRTALRFAAAIEKATDEQLLAADINEDGIISLDDVISILKIASGIEVELPSNKPVEEPSTTPPTTSPEDTTNPSTPTPEDTTNKPSDESSGTLSGEAYKEGLIKQGFPKSYVDYLSNLHDKYPEWEFVPMITNLEWKDVINGERSPHKKQLIENSVQASYMCSCSSCKGVIQEASCWVSASEEAVKYYMDPRNFLTEEYIFQFESTAYDEAHTQEGVEAILKNTWMHNSTIKYLDATGKENTYKENNKEIKYSEAIMKAAKDSGMSAYYLASKIVQEVGSSSSSYAGGSSGKSSPYNGIYNYYNIGAYTGAGDGLRWANGYMKTKMEATMYKTASTSGTKVITVPISTELNFIETSGSFCKVSAKVKGTTYTGYVSKTYISTSTSYGRPWTNPYKTIYHGAQYIYDSFSKTQYTGYLQKFNVNPESSNLYNHEYMANVRAAAAESKKAYKAYVSANILNTKKVFSIPVFKNIPGGDTTREEYFQKAKPVMSATSTTNSIVLSWTGIDYAEIYRVYKYDNKEGKYVRINSTSSTSYTDTSAVAGEISKYKVRAYYTDDNGEKVYSSYSAVIEAATAPDNVKEIKLKEIKENIAHLEWTAVKCAGYDVYRYDAVSGVYVEIGSTASASYADKDLGNGVYRYKVRPYNQTTSDKYYAEGYSGVVVVVVGQESSSLIGKVNISDGYLNIRSSASTSGTVLAQLKKDTEVIILDITGDWYKITFTQDNKTIAGYAHKNYIQVIETEPEKEKCPYTEPTTTLRQGSSGESVKWLQWHLYKLGYLTEKDIDGDFGPTTLKVSKQFQTDCGLDVDGVIGPASRATLKTAYENA